MCRLPTGHNICIVLLLLISRTVLWTMCYFSATQSVIHGWMLACKAALGRLAQPCPGLPVPVIHTIQQAHQVPALSAGVTPGVTRCDTSRLVLNPRPLDPGVPRLAWFPASSTLLSSLSTKPLTYYCHDGIMPVVLACRMA